MSENLKDIAKRVQNEHQTQKNNESAEEILSNNINNIIENQPEETEEDLYNDDIEDDEDAAIVIGGETDGVAHANVVSDVVDDIEDGFELSDDDLKAEMPDLDDISFNQASEKIRGDIDRYRKDLIVNSGFTIDEANKAAINRMKKLSKEENSAYLEENPKLGIVEIDKKDVDKLEFTPEEREKLTKVKAIKLKVMEDVELSTLSVERVDKRHKSSMIQSLDLSLSQYSVPLPLMSDYCRFKGSQTIQLIQAVHYEDATLDETISKKASLVYAQLANSANLEKFDEDGKTIMSYQDFINKFLFHDLDMALYGILVASSMEDIESTLTCGKCSESFQWKYNLKTLLNLDELSDDFKQKFDDILAHKTDEGYLQNLYKENYKSVKVKSPITNNVYELNYPTVARAINLYRLIDNKDELMIYLSAFALFISKMHIFNTKTQKYVPIEEDEYKDLMDVLQMIPQEEIDIIQEFLKPYLYSPKFILKSKCPVCGHEMTNELSIDNLVFLKARDSSTEIQS